MQPQLYKTLIAAEATLTKDGFERTKSKQHGNPDVWIKQNQTAWVCQQSRTPHCFYIRIVAHDDALPFDPPYKTTGDQA
jgi:hypothetical protein